MRHMKTHESNAKFVLLVNSCYLTTGLTLHWYHDFHVVRGRGHLGPAISLLLNSPIVIDDLMERPKPVGKL